MKAKEITKEYLEEYNDIEIIKRVLLQEIMFDSEFNWQDLKEEVNAINNAEDLEKFIERRLNYSIKNI